MDYFIGFFYLVTFLVLAILLIYLLRKRIKDKKLENFEQRKN